MHVKTLRTYQFRNLRDGTIEFSSRFNAIEGENGQGKTNIVEALTLVAQGRSFRGAQARDLPRHGTDECAVFVELETSEGALELGIQVKNGRSRGLVNQKPVAKLASFIGRLLEVDFSPTDLELVRGGPALRRSFLDKYVLDLTPTLFDHYLRFQKALKTKQALLADEIGTPQTLAPLNAILAESGAKIVAARFALVSALAPEASAIYRGLAPEDPEIRLTYHACVAPERVSSETLLAELERRAQEEIRRGRCTFGPQRDDLELVLGERPAVDHASQGQTRSFVLSMKLALLELVERERRERPIVILDDVESELDERRRQALFDAVRSSTGQVFLTGTKPRFETGPSGEKPTFFTVLEGGVSRRSAEPASSN